MALSELTEKHLRLDICPSTYYFVPIDLVAQCHNSMVRISIMTEDGPGANSHQWAQDSTI